MRIALISIVEQNAAEVRLGGHPIAWHQAQAAFALGCERIVCLAEAPGRELAALHREVERRGASFHAVAHHRALLGLVSAADTLFAFAPGVVPDGAWLTRVFAARHGVAVLPAEGAVAHGFERIDRERAWAGVLATRGDAVEALAALAPDADAIAGLLRVALQRGGAAVEIPAGWLDEGRWALVLSPASGERHHHAWYARHAPSPAVVQPGRALAYRLARLAIERLPDPTRTARALTFGGGMLAAGAGVAGYLGYTAAALAALALASTLLATGSAIGRLIRAGSDERIRRWPAELRRAALDVPLVVIAASPVAFEGWVAAYAALVLVAVMRLANAEAASPPTRPLGDRSLMLLVLALAATRGAFAPAAALLSLLGLALQLFWPNRRG